jgi:hypothetical protein
MPSVPNMNVELTILGNAGQRPRIAGRSLLLNELNHEKQICDSGTNVDVLVQSTEHCLDNNVLGVVSLYLVSSSGSPQMYSIII